MIYTLIFFNESRISCPWDATLISLITSWMMPFLSITKVLRFARPAMLVPAYFLQAIFFWSLRCTYGISYSLTKVSFRSFVYDESKLNRGAGNQLQKVEEEDEFVVENVHNGLRSAFYKAGRFSTTREQGVHHFHKLISEFMNQWLRKLNSSII